MKSIKSVAAAWLALLSIFFSPSLIAGPGHDHAASAPIATATSLPRFTATSEDLELVGIINDKRLTIYLDRFADNAPINDAQIELDIAGNKFKAEKHGDGEYEINLKESLKSGVFPITVTVAAGDLNDLLTTELDLHQDQETRSSGSWKSIAWWSGAALTALLALGLVVRFRSQKRTA